MMVWASTSVSIDQGTTSFPGRCCSIPSAAWPAWGRRNSGRSTPSPAFVEHDAVQILQTTLFAMRQAVAQAGVTAADIAAISITNQRETPWAWDAVRASRCATPSCGSAAAPPPRCERLRREGWEDYIRDTTA